MVASSSGRRSGSVGHQSFSRQRCGALTFAVVGHGHCVREPDCRARRGEQQCETCELRSENAIAIRFDTQAVWNANPDGSGFGRWLPDELWSSVGGLTFEGRLPEGPGTQIER